MFDRCKSFPLETLSSINREHPQFETWSHRNILRFSHMDQHQHVRANTHLWNRSRLPLRLTERVLCYEEKERLSVFFYIPLICLPLVASSDTHTQFGRTPLRWGGPGKTSTFMLEAVLALLPMAIHHVWGYFNDFRRRNCMFELLPVSEILTKSMIPIDMYDLCENNYTIDLKRTKIRTKYS